MDLSQTSATTSPRFCDSHLARAGQRVPASHFVSGEALCSACFDGEPVRAIERSSEEKSAQLGKSFCPRETEVTRLVANGLSNREIAAALNLAERTVKFWVSRALAKSGAPNRIQLSSWFKGETSVAVTVLPRRGPTAGADPPRPSARGSLEIIEHELRNLSAGLRVDLSPVENATEDTCRLLERAAQLRRDAELEESDFVRRLTKLAEERKEVQSALRSRVTELARSIEHLKSRFLDERKASIVGEG